MPFLIQRLLTILGWRGAYACLGLIVLFVGVPVVGLFVKENPEEMGLLPDGEAVTHATASERQSRTGCPEVEARP